MAFMMPVLKNDYNIYKSNHSQSHRTSECSNSQNFHSRKISECAKSKDASLVSAKAGSDCMVASPAHRSIPQAMSSRQFARNSSKVSHLSLQSPSKSCSPLPPKSNSMSSLSPFHNKFWDRLRRSFKSKDSSSDDSHSSLPSTDGARRKS